MRKIIKAIAGIMLVLAAFFLLRSGCAKPHFEVTYFAAASEYSLPGDIKIGRDGYIVIAAQYGASYFGSVHVLVSDIPQDDWWWRQITPVGYFQDYWFYMLPEKYADHDMGIEMANNKVQIKSDLQLDRTGIGERRNSDFLNTTDSKEWQRNDWNALVNLTARAYAKNPTGSDTFFGTVGWDGARLVEKMDSFSQSHTLFIKSTNSFDYSFEQDFLDRLLDGDSGAITLAMDFFRNPYGPECIIYYNYRDVSNTYDVYINGVKSGQTTRTSKKAYAEIRIYNPRDNQSGAVENTNSYSFTEKELKAKLKKLISQMQP